MQRFRHLADYDHNATFTAHEAMAYLDRAETAILDYPQVAMTTVRTRTITSPRLTWQCPPATITSQLPAGQEP